MTSTEPFDDNQLHISNSEMKDFNLCPRMWWFAWVLRCEVPGRPWLDLGTLVHLVLERYHKGEIPGDHLADVALEEGAKAEPEVDVRSVLTALERYVKGTRRLYEDFEIEGVETEVYWPIPDTDGLMFKAILDVLGTDSRGRRVVVDHKTAKSFDFRYLKVDQQATSYLWMTKASHVVFSFLKKIIKPGPDTEIFAQVQVNRTPGALDRFERQLSVVATVAHEARADTRETGAVPDITPGSHCRDCHFLGACGLMEHGHEDMAKQWLGHNTPPENPIEWSME
jgi:CRISPR/Cas system-associated exonuclease Cas4 (RecB family)